MEALAIVGPMLLEAAPYAGMALEAGGSIYSGVREQENAQATAAALKQKGDQELAIAQRQALASKREGDLAQSRARAVAAASGGGTGDATVTKIMADIETKRDTNVLTDMYRGFQARDDLYRDAKTRKKEGDDAFTAGLLDAGASIYSGIGRIGRDRKRLEYED